MAVLHGSILHGQYTSLAVYFIGSILHWQYTSLVVLHWQREMGLHAHAPPPLPPPVSFSQEEDDGTGGTIKIGLGDFVFFSVLSAQAAAYGFEVVIAASLGVLLVRN
jgi:hypothetical protein